MIRAGGAAAEARLERELQEAEEKRIREKKKLDEMGGLQRRASRLANSDTEWLVVGNEGVNVLGTLARGL